MTAALTNPSQYADLTGLTLHVTDASGGIFPAITDVILLPDMIADGTQTISVPLKVKTNSSISLHTLKFDLSWPLRFRKGKW